MRIEEKDQNFTKKIITTTVTEEYHRIQRKIIEEFDKGISSYGIIPSQTIYLSIESNEEVSCHNLDRSNNEEQYNTQQSLKTSVSREDQSPYELLSECYSGYSLVQSDFLTLITTPLVSNVSLLHSTTDEAYESEPTTTTLSLTQPVIDPSVSTAITMSSHLPITNSSIATTTITTHVHPDLEHEFEYPSPPPPVPDRSLKPVHLRPPPATKPRSHKQKQKNSTDCSTVQRPEPSPLTTIEHLMASSPSDLASSKRTLSSRHYCGPLPLSKEPTTSSSKSQAKTKATEILKIDSQTHYFSNSTTNNDNKNRNNTRQMTLAKPSSLNKAKSATQSSEYVDEATNGLAIRLPASKSIGHNRTNKQHFKRFV